MTAAVRVVYARSRTSNALGDSKGERRSTRYWAAG